MARTGACLALLAVLALPGCASVGYYAQSVTGHLGLMVRARPVEAVIGAPDTAPGLAARLRAALEMRDFASDALALPANASYRRYVDLGRRYVVRTVVAAPELSLEPRRWCFPVAGCVSYRGYFSESDADAYAAKLESEGWDVTVSGVRAYSTLGWFDDPLLSSMVELPEYSLAGIVFHELAHQRLYVPGDTDFNESFAVVVERAGVRRWIEAAGRDGLRERHRIAAERRAAFLDLARGTRRDLEAVYASSRTDAEKRAAKTRAFERLRSRYASLRSTWTSGPSYDFWFERGVNNAAMALLTAYDRWVPALEALLAAPAATSTRSIARATSSRRCLRRSGAPGWRRWIPLGACHGQGTCPRCRVRNMCRGDACVAPTMTAPRPGLATRTARYARFPAL